MNCQVVTSRNASIFGTGKPRPRTPELPPSRGNSGTAEDPPTDQLADLQLDAPAAGTADDTRDPPGPPGPPGTRDPDDPRDRDGDGDRDPDREYDDRERDP